MDKILVFLLVLILPITIFLSAKAYNDQLASSSKEEAKQQEQVDKVIEDLEKKLDTKLANSQTDSKKFKINGVTYATSSGELRVTGIAPGKNLNVMVSATVTPHQEESEEDKNSTDSAKKKDKDNSKVLAEQVEMVAIKTNEKGEFEYERVVEFADYDLIEIRLEQADSATTLQYDLRKNKRLL